jgi:hypothetical protein
MSARFERATLRVRTFRPAAGFAIAALLCLCLVFAGLAGGPPWMGVVGLVGSFWWGAFLLAFGRWPPKRSRVGTVTAEEQGLGFEGKLVAPTLRLLDGRVRWRRDGGPYVDFLDARIQVDLVRDEDAFALIEALALERARGVATFTAGGLPSRWGTLAVLVGLAGLTAAAINVGAEVGWLWLVAVLVTPFVAKTRVRVGRDGVLVQCLGWSRFTPYADIVHIEHDRTNVWMHTLDGRRLHVPGARGLEGTLRRAIARSRPKDDVANQLAQAGRSAREWLAALHGVRPRPSEVHYRVAQVPDARLWAVVEDARAEPSARLGAAAALADGIDERGRVRLADAARATAHPELRVALERVASSRASAEAEGDLASVLQEWFDATAGRRS